jgi:hypothetical protein
MHCAGNKTASKSVSINNDADGIIKNSAETDSLAGQRCSYQPM